MGQSLPQFLLGWTRPLQGLFQDETFLLTVTAHPFQHHKTRCQVGWITKCETDPCLRAHSAHFVGHLANPRSSAWTRNRGRLYIRESKEEGRMSRLQLRKRSGKVVLERAEGVRIASSENPRKNSNTKVLSPRRAKQPPEERASRCTRAVQGGGYGEAQSVCDRDGQNSPPPDQRRVSWSAGCGK